jgi:hypothetical protein
VHASVNRRFVLWLTAQQVSVLPQAMAPIVFGVMSVNMTESPAIGAAMVLAMTSAQFFLAVPLGSMGHRLPVDFNIKLLLLTRSVSTVIVLMAYLGHGHPLSLILGSAGFGMGNGAIAGLFRSSLRHTVNPDSMTQAAAVSATLNELMFVIGPLAAGVFAFFNIAYAVVMMWACSILAIVLGRVRGAPSEEEFAQPEHVHRSLLLTKVLLCYTATAASVAVIEVGSVALARAISWSTASAAILTSCLCIASFIGGGIMVVTRASVQSRIPFLILVSLAGTVIVAFSDSPVAVCTGCALIGLALAPISTAYTLIIDQRVSLQAQSRAFSAMRAAQAAGVMVVSLFLIALPVVTIARLAVIALAVAFLVSLRLG